MLIVNFILNDIFNLKMIVNQFKNFFKIYKIILFLPFNYDEKSNSLKCSNILILYSTIATSLLLSFGCVSTVLWISRFAKETKIMNDADMFCMALLWFTNICVGILFLFDIIFCSAQASKLLNEILKMEQFVAVRHKRFLNYLILHTILEVVIFPISMLILNAVFFYVTFKKIDLTLFCLGITLCTLWIRIWFLPIQFLFEYFQSILEYFNKLLFVSLTNNVNNPKNDDFHDFNFVVDKYSIIYTQVTECLKYMSRYYGLHVIVYFWGVNFSTVWQIYRAFDLLFIKITPLKTGGVALTNIFYLFNLMWIIKCTFDMLRSISNLIIIYQKTGVFLNDLLQKSLTIKVHQRVS